MAVRLHFGGCLKLGGIFGSIRAFGGLLAAIRRCFGGFFAKFRFVAAFWPLFGVTFAVL